MLSSSSTLRVAFITDIHLGGLIECRPGEEAMGLLASFVSTINNCLHPDIVIEMGDRVNNFDSSADLKNLKTVVTLLGGLHVPRFSIFGNHDVHYLGKNETMRILGIPSPYYSKIVNGFKLIFMDTTDPVVDECGGMVSKKQLNWLDNEVTCDDLPKIVIGHHPIAIQNQNGNPFFVHLPGQQYVSNWNEVQTILRKGKKVIAYFNGHVHWFYSQKINGISFFSMSSLLESWPEKSHAPGNFGFAIVKSDGHLDISYHSLAPARVLGRVEQN